MIKRINQARENGKKILFYVGCNDWLMGMRPIWLDHEERKASPFIDTYDALNELIRLARKNNWHLIFKPHPHYNSSLLQKILQKHIYFKDITISYSGNIFEFISVADVVITLMSSASYESLLHNVPVVLLGIHPMSKKGIAFECTHCSELETVIEMAIKRECWSEKKKAWKLFLARMIKYYLFPQSEDIATLMNKSIDEAARFLLKQVKFGKIKPL
jgi:CDP-glycerol glycerophosphotransferase (TagB/SpsB family)